MSFYTSVPQFPPYFSGTTHACGGWEGVGNARGLSTFSGEELAGDTSPEAELAVCPLHAHLSVKKVAYRNQFGVP